ncbi:hypothetical protein [Schlesneria sp. T3-172]|uniref:hypothetical protein n=1 Tax=Schlesneria sphaerica TaxID=3373610 RepID=UPI0037C8F22C
MFLLRKYPRIARMNCQVCEKYVVNESTWQLEQGRDGQPVERLKHLGPSFLAACRDPARGCPKGTPELPNSLTAENQLCYQHYCECVSTGSFPDDPVVRRNAAVIQGVLDTVEKLREVERHNSLLKAVRETCVM